MFVTLALAGSPAPAAAAQPARTDIDAAMKRTFGYDPDVHWKILRVRPSKVSGMTEVVVDVNGNVTTMYISADARNAIVGELIPFGLDPFAPARAKLRIADGPRRNSGPIDLVIFNDFQCAHCKATQPLLDRIATDFPEVRQVFVEFPLPTHPWAHRAALWADCVGRKNEKVFWAFADAVFGAQEEITTDTVDAKLGKLAKDQGLDPDLLVQCVRSPGTESRLKASAALGAQLDVAAAPTAFLNGRRVTDPAGIPYESMKQLIRFEIDHANR